MGVSCVQTPGAVKILAELSRDKVAKVRDWATFSLGAQQSADTPLLRRALRARLLDKDFDTRLEAICGLAIRKDWEGLVLLSGWLKKGKAAPGCIVDAAKELGIDQQ